MSAARALLAKALRACGDRAHDFAGRHGDEQTRELLYDASEIARVLARLIEGKSLHSALGAPGDWGYGRPIGQGIAAVYGEGLGFLSMRDHARLLQRAESFIAGFEDDASQQGVTELLAELRAAMKERA